MKRHRKWQLVIAAVVAMGMAGSAFSFDFSKLENSITEHKLKNGLTILVMENHEAPVVSFVTWANVGSVDDPKGYSGIAHMFEHMAFKGTTTLGTKDYNTEKGLIAKEDSIFMELRHERTKGRLADSTRLHQLEQAYEQAREEAYGEVKPNEYGQIISREGGVGLNAFTAEDQTAFFYSLPSNKVELWMALESERFLHPVLREMYKERDVVAEERRMRVESNPVGRLIEEFLTMAYTAHPYGVPGVGYMSDIQYYSRKEARAFFEKYYGPANLTIAIVGDVNTKDVIKLAEKYWGRIPYRPAPDRIATVEPPQAGERREVIDESSQPVYVCGWHIPEATHPDRPAIDAMMDYLAQGRTSLLYKRLVKEKKIAAQIGGFSGFPGDKYPGMALIFAMPAKGHTNQECETEIFAAVEELKNDTLATAEVEKIRARAKASFINGLKSNQGMAMQLCRYQQIWGDWRQMFHELDRINKVTPADIQRVAKTYLTKNNRTVAMINNTES